MALPGWESIETVGLVAKIAGVSAISFLALLAIFEYIAHLWKSVEHIFTPLAIAVFSLAVGRTRHQETSVRGMR